MIRWFEKYNKLSWGITLIGAIAIFYISSLQIKGGGGSSGILSIVYHFSAFFCLAFFLFISSVQGKKNPQVFFIAILTVLIYGILDELHQFFVPGRVCTFFDIGIDSLGVLFALLIYFIRLNYNGVSI